MAKRELLLKLARRTLGYLQQGWCQLTSARNAANRPTKPASYDACCWCLTGAITAAVQHTEGATLQDEYCLRKQVESEIYLSLVAEMDPARVDGENPGVVAERWNDAVGRTKDQVIRVMEAVVARLSA
jgi:hypothetical protein